MTELLDDLLARAGEETRLPALRRAVLARWRERKPTLEEAAAAMDEAARDPRREPMLLATLLVARHRTRLRTLRWARVESWADAVEEWETCDALAAEVVGEMLAQDLALLPRVKRLAQSPEPWVRRLAAASTTRLNQRKRSHPKETFQVLALLAEDEDERVQKAVAWAVREASKKDPDAAHRFLKRHARKLPPWALREAARKLDPEDALSLSLAAAKPARRRAAGP